MTRKIICALFVLMFFASFALVTDGKARAWRDNPSAFVWDEECKGDLPNPWIRGNADELIIRENCQMSTRNENCNTKGNEDSNFLLLEIKRIIRNMAIPF